MKSHIYPDLSDTPSIKLTLIMHSLNNVQTGRMLEKLWESKRVCETAVGTLMQMLVVMIMAMLMVVAM